VEPTARRWPALVDWVFGIVAVFWTVMAVAVDGPPWEKAVRAFTALACVFVVVVRWRQQARSSV
jgi:hypothetical protein